jgi:hypothetical protein
MRHYRAFLFAVAIGLLPQGCASLPSTYALATERTFIVIVSSPFMDGAPLGRPIIVRIRAVDGRLLASAETDEHGEITIRVRFEPRNPPYQIEAIADDHGSVHPIGAFGGAVVSVRQNLSKYCLSLPSECVF